MGTNIISVKYEDRFSPKTFSGKAYSYFTDLTLEVGDLVEAPTQYGDNLARVSRINIPEDEIESIRPYMKTITKKINKDDYLNYDNITQEVA